MTAPVCGLPPECFLDEMRQKAGLADPAKGRPVCPEPATVRLLMWPGCYQPTVDVCTVHALGAAVWALQSTPRIRGAEPVPVAVSS